MTFDLIYADPPWKRFKGGLRKSRPNQGKELDYNVESIENIKDILNNFKSTPVFFLWTIDKYLHESEIMMKNFGYKLHARIIWNKTNGVAPAFTIRYSHEYLLWFYKSPMVKIDKSMRGKYTTVITEKATKHSKKPQIAYEMIERLYPRLTKLELFSRNKRDGWLSWGNEVDNDIELKESENETK